MDQFQRLFRTDSFDTVVEIGTDQDRKVDQLLARNPVVPKHRAGIDQLWRDGSKNTFARKKFFSGDREKTKKARRAEQQAIVIFARRGPNAACGGHVRCLRFSFGWGFDDGDSHQPQQFFGFVDHGSAQTRSHSGFGIGPGQIARLHRFGMFRVILLFNASPACDLRRLQRRWFTVENEGQLHLIVRDQARRAVEQSQKMRGDAVMRIHQRRAVSQADQGQELVQFSVAVYRHAFSLQLFQSQRLFYNDRGEKNAHSGPIIQVMALTETEFRFHCDAALEKLNRSLDVVAENYDAEVVFQNNVLTIEVEEPSPGKIVISPQTPTRQIWISAQSTSFKLDWSGKTFVLSSSGESLNQLVGRLIGEQLGVGKIEIYEAGL